MVSLKDRLEVRAAIAAGLEADEVAMSEITRIKSIEPIRHGVVKIVWLEGTRPSWPCVR
jgi:hypothetical protein